MKFYYICFVLFFVTGIVFAGEVGLFDFEEPLYSVHDEQNDQGTINFSFAPSFKSTKCLKVDYDFSASQFPVITANIPIDYDSPLNESLGLSFMAKGTKGDNLLVRVVDCSGEIYQYMVYLEDGDWHKYSFYFDDKDINIWAGDENRYVNHPIAYLALGVHRGDINKGSISFDDICGITKDTKELSDNQKKEALSEIDFKLDTGKPGNLFYYEEIPIGKIVPVYNLLDDFDVDINLIYRDAYGNFLPSEVKNIKFNTKSPVSFNLPKIKGYGEIEYSAKFLGKEKVGIFRYGCIPDNSKVSLGKKSPFGVNTHFNQGWPEYFGDIVKRAGISWLRDGEARLNDNAYFVAKKRQIQYMPTFTGVMQNASLGYIYAGLAEGKSAEDVWDFAPFVKNFGEYAKKYGDYVFVYDILNEPNGNGWLSLGGDWAGGPWLDVFMKWGKEVSRELKENDKDALVLWEDSEGFTWSDSYVKAGLNKEIDFVSPHAYNSHRTFPLPEMSLCLLNYPRVIERDRERNNWKYIIGEIGCPTYIETEATLLTDTYPAVTEIMQAAQTVRIYVMHLNAGAERIFLYDLKNDGFNKNNAEHEFGITDFYGNPKPVICAYSVMVNLLEGCKWIGRESNENTGAYIYGYKNREGERCAVCWVPSTYFYDGGHEGGPIWTYQLTEGPAYLKTQKEFVKEIDMFGNETYLKAEKGRVRVELSKYPKYIIGL
ncbi:MAG: hypothetical protein IJS60_00030 [Abditibacteriota bacterium]|nr:hypothetical protein [Abditibacteriota bacterium]